jgi:anti-sigma regulatory factor (Ser/Thr protein kinase)
VARIEIRLPPVPSSVPSARREVRAWLESLPVDPDTRDDVLVVLSELVTHGVLHDGGEHNGGEVIAVSASGDPAGVSLEVDTAHRANDSPSPWVYRELNDPSESGRGLSLVSALADSVVTVAGSGRRQIRCHVSSRATPDLA